MTLPAKILLLPAPVKLTRVCGWCPTIIEQGDPQPHFPTTGVCDKCLVKYFDITRAQLDAAHKDYTLRGGPRPRGD